MLFRSGPSGERYTLYCGLANAPQTAMRYHAGEQIAAFYWVDRDLAYVLTGPSEREKLLKVAQAAYDQIETRTPEMAQQSK